MIAEQKLQIDTVSIVESTGIELRQTGRRHVGLCPFHADKNPSFHVFEDGFKCMGCGEYGDVIDFVRKFYNLSFLDALKHLGIESGEITPEEKAKIDKKKRKAELVKQFKKWSGDYGAWLGMMINRTYKLMKGITPDDLDLFTSLLHALPVWEHHSEILLEGSDKQKYELYKEARKNGRFRFSRRPSAR